MLETARAHGVTVREVYSGAEWNALVLGLPYPALEQSYEWGEARRVAGWRPYRYVASVEGVPTAAMSITTFRLPRTPWSVLYASRGPLVDWDGDAGRAFGALVEASRDLAARTGAIFLRMSPGIPHDAERMHEIATGHGCLPLPYDWTIWNAPRVIMTLDGRGPEDVLKRQLRRRTRDYITSAPKRGLSTRYSVAEADLRAFHASLIAMGTEKGFPVRGLRYFEALWQQLVVPGRGVLVVAEQNGRTVGGLLGAQFGRRAYLLSTSVHGADNGALHQGPVLYWEFIRWARAAGCEVIDLAGSGTNYPPHERDPGFGIYRFKQGFGASPTCLMPYYDLPFRPGLYRMCRAAESKLFPSAWRIRGALNHLTGRRP